MAPLPTHAPTEQRDGQRRLLTINQQQTRLRSLYLGRIERPGYLFASKTLRVCATRATISLIQGETELIEARPIADKRLPPAL